MAFFTKADARQAAQRAMKGQKAAEVLKRTAERYAPSEEFDIFLSHSIQDAELVLGIKVLLEEQELRVYVDWIEDALLDRTRVSPKTAEVLRSRMRQSKSLLYIATDNATSSKWMPWELGYFDGFKGGEVSILPVVEKGDAAFEGQEYLGLYPVETKEGIAKRKKRSNNANIRTRVMPGLIVGDFPFTRPKTFL